MLNIYHTVGSVLRWKGIMALYRVRRDIVALSFMVDKQARSFARLSVQSRFTKKTASLYYRR